MNERPRRVFADDYQQFLLEEILDQFKAAFIRADAAREPRVFKSRSTGPIHRPMKRARQIKPGFDSSFIRLFRKRESA